jgi:glycosyltransferase involved in cell wall biosynthesis
MVFLCVAASDYIAAGLAPVMKVSVIIPVYNAREFVSRAVTSALDQPETAEVILVDDGSTDGSHEICQQLAAGDTRITLYTHPDHQNHGASATRNLGLTKCTADLIAFLDSDDLYSTKRFQETKQIFARHSDADGVHETIGVHYEDEALRKSHLDRTYREYTGLSKSIPPKDLYNALATGRYGHFSLDALTIKRESLGPDLKFDPALEQCEDSDFILRLARHRTLYGGRIDVPVAMRRVHDDNSVHNKQKRIYYQRAFLRKCIDHRFYGSTNRYANAYIVARYVQWWKGGFLRRAGIFSRPSILLCTAIYLIGHPRIFINVLFPGRGMQ